MIKDVALISCIEELRLKKKLTLTEFTEGIVSERTYRRYVNASEAFSFEVLISLVKRLNMRMKDVITFAFNQLSVKHQEEIYFAHYATLRQNEHAKPYYEKLIGKTLQSHLSSIYVPILLHYYDYPKDYIAFAKKRIEFDTLKRTTILNRQTLDALVFMLPDLNEVDTIEAITFLLKLIRKEVTLLSAFHTLDVSKAVLAVFQTMTTSKSLMSLFQSDVDFIYARALSNIVSEHLVSNYPAFFEAVILYARQIGDLVKEKRFIYFDVCFQMTLDIPLNRTHLYSKKEGLDMYLDHVKDMPLLTKEVL